MSSASWVIYLTRKVFQTLPTGIWVGGLEPESVMMWTGEYELRKMTAKWTRNYPSQPVQDAAMATFHFLNLTGDAPDATWTTTDYQSIESKFDTFWGAIIDRYAPSYVLSELTWRADGPAYRPHTPKPAGLLAPTLRTVARAVAGSGASQPLPPQCAVSVTEVTSAKFTVEDVEGSGAQVRNRWGRFYLPPIMIDQIIGGRVATTASADIANAAEAFYNAAIAADLVPVMYSPTTGNAWSVDELHVDDIIDVIRSRRFITPITRNARVLVP